MMEIVVKIGSIHIVIPVRVEMEYNRLQIVLDVESEGRAHTFVNELFFAFARYIDPNLVRFLLDRLREAGVKIKVEEP